MNDSFWAGFEKESYDYAYERKDYARKNKETSQRSNPSISNHMLATGLPLAALGAAVGGKGGLRGSLGRALGGGVVGAGLGALSALSGRNNIENAKKVEMMPAKEREEYFHHRAREDDRNRVQHRIAYGINI